ACMFRTTLVSSMAYSQVILVGRQVELRAIAGESWNPRGIPHSADFVRKDMFFLRWAECFFDCAQALRPGLTFASPAAIAGAKLRCWRTASEGGPYKGRPKSPHAETACGSPGEKNPRAQPGMAMPREKQVPHSADF